MTTGKVDFSSVRWGSVEWTNLVTLYLRAYESRSRRPIVGDHAAAAAVGRIDYDFKRMQRNSLPASNQYLVALRAKQLNNARHMETWNPKLRFLEQTPATARCEKIDTTAERLIYRLLAVMPFGAYDTLNRFKY